MNYQYLIVVDGITKSDLTNDFILAVGILKGGSHDTRCHQSLYTE